MLKKNNNNSNGIYIFKNADDFINAMKELQKQYNEMNNKEKSNE